MVFCLLEIIKMDTKDYFFINIMANTADCLHPSRTILEKFQNYLVIMLAFFLIDQDFRVGTINMIR